MPDFEDFTFVKIFDVSEFILSKGKLSILQHSEALESVMCDVIKIRLKRRIATRSGKGNIKY